MIEELKSSGLSIRLPRKACIKHPFACVLQLVSLEEKRKEDEVGPGESGEPVVIDFTENDSEKKVRPRIKSKERRIRSAKTARTTSVRFIRDVSFGRANHPLVLYQEICV